MSVHVSSSLRSLSHPIFNLVLSAEQKEEKDGVKAEELAKLQNGDSVKEGAAARVSEEKKKAKTRFMFNIADGGFTGKRTGVSRGKAYHKRMRRSPHVLSRVLVGFIHG